MLLYITNYEFLKQKGKLYAAECPRKLIVYDKLTGTTAVFGKVLLLMIADEIRINYSYFNNCFIGVPIIIF